MAAEQEGEEEEEGETDGGGGDEEWDCQFTDVAMITTPENQPDGDPVKVNEYVFEKHLGSGKKNIRPALP